MKALKIPSRALSRPRSQVPAPRRRRLRRRPKAARLLTLVALLAALLCVSPWYLSPTLCSSVGHLFWDAKSAVVELLFTVAAVAIQRRN